MDRAQLGDERALGRIKNLGARNVTGQQVRCALDAAELCTDGLRNGLRGSGLGKAWNTFQ